MNENERELQLVFDEAASLKRVQEELADAKHTIHDMTETIQALQIENEDLRSYNRNLRSLVKILADENESSHQYQQEASPVRKTTTIHQKQNVPSSQRKKNSKNLNVQTTSPISQRSKKNHALQPNEEIKTTVKAFQLPSIRKNVRRKNQVAKESEEIAPDKKLLLREHYQTSEVNDHNGRIPPSANNKKSSVNGISTKAIKGSTSGFSRTNVLQSSSFSNFAKLESSIHGSDIVDIPLDIPLEFRPETASEPISVVTEASSYGSFSVEKNEDARRDK
jgi:hypothetical protein